MPSTFDSRAYVDEAIHAFAEASDPLRAQQMEAYMKNHFSFFGVASPVRKEIQRPFLLKGNIPDISELEATLKLLWSQPQRELQYFAMDLLSKYKKKFRSEDISWLEDLVLEKSWWDTVDLIATTPIGGYFKLFPESIPQVTAKWMESQNMWLQRTCLLFQLKYKKDLDTALLEQFIEATAHSEEFFLRKAIGWALRQHSKVDPEWVSDFLNSHTLSNLSIREASKYL